jgi:hypothetical protein
LDHAEAFQNLDIPGHCASVALQFLRQHADRCRRFFHLLEQKHPFRCEDMKESLNVFEGDYRTGRNAVALIRRLRKFTPPLEERVYPPYPNFSLAHGSCRVRRVCCLRAVVLMYQDLS